MSRPLSVILAGLLIDDQFRNVLVELRSNRSTLRASLAGYGFFLNSEDLTTVQAMLEDFSGTAMEPARGLIKAACPDWPCSKFMISGD